MIVTASAELACWHETRMALALQDNVQCMHLRNISVGSRGKRFISVHRGGSDTIQAADQRTVMQFGSTDGHGHF